jgi:branched-chain amino acid aminotransferase
MPGFFMYDGKYFPDATPVLGPDSRAFRYGDGIFETMRVSQGQIPLVNYHFIRCFAGLNTLGFDIPALFTPGKLEHNILTLCRKNNHLENARVRISIFRGNGGLFDPESHRPQYLMQTWDLPEHYKKMNDNGLELTIYPPGRKSCDPLSNLKSNNALIYVMAAKYAKDQKCNEALVLNTTGKIADATIANLFWVKDGAIFTNPLSDGIVAGVMREFLIDNLLRKGMPVSLQSIDPDELLEADEIFLTNALFGIRWVGSLGKKQFRKETSSLLYEESIIPLFR